MSDSPESVVQDYIQMLLVDEAQPVAPVAVTPVAQTVAKTAPPQLEVAEQIHTLEAKKRAQLQKLLQPQLAVAQVSAPPVQAVPVTTAPVKAPEVKRPEVKPTELKQAKPKVEPVKTEKQPSVPSKAMVEPPAPALECKKEHATELDLDPLLAWHENGRPVWAQERFDVLLFQVSGLTLAVPLIALGQIHTLNEDLTPIFGQAEWFMGLQPTSHGQIRCVNTAMFVMPERYNASFLETAKYVISIDGLDWGLVVDKVQQPTRIHPDDVTWRGERSKRPWLAGTVKSAMCALIDVPRMGQLLQASDPKRRR